MMLCVGVGGYISLLLWLCEKCWAVKVCPAPPLYFACVFVTEVMVAEWLLPGSAGSGLVVVRLQWKRQFVVQEFAYKKQQ